MGTRTRLRRTDDEEVVCIACGATLRRDDAREYDKYGDRWDRDGKTFEYLCKPCFRECGRHARDGVEEALVAAGAGTVERSVMLERFCGE